MAADESGCSQLVAGGAGCTVSLPAPGHTPHHHRQHAELSAAVRCQYEGSATSAC